MTTGCQGILLERELDVGRAPSSRTQHPVQAPRTPNSAHPHAVARPAPAHHLDNVRRKLVTVTAAVSILAGALLQAQGFRRFVWEPNVPYDGKFTFARISYTVYGRRSGWEYDYPAMERHLMTMVEEITELQPHRTGSNIHALDDPELLKYPVAYLSEPGYWHPSESEVLGLRTYLAKGGFLIVDDFMQERVVQLRTRDPAGPAGREHRAAQAEPSGIRLVLPHRVVRHAPPPGHMASRRVPGNSQG